MCVLYSVYACPLSDNDEDEDPSIVRDSDCFSTVPSREKHFSFRSFTPEDDEIMEDDELQIPGETSPNEDDKSIPIRILSDYTIYDLDTKQIIMADELLQLGFCQESYAASGLVGAWFNGDGSDIEQGSDVDQSDDGRTSISDAGTDRITLSKILEFSVHAFSNDGDILDPKIYVRTRFAWYILGCPSQSYNIYFAPFWTRHRLLHLLITAASTNKHTEYHQFIKNLPVLDKAEDSVATAKMILGRNLNEEDVRSDDMMAYIISTLPDICAANGIRISSVPVIWKIMGESHYNFDVKAPKPAARKSISSAAQKSANREKEVLKHRSKTFLTEVVNRIAKNLFEVSLDVAESLADQDDGTEGTYVKLPHFKAHYSDPQHIVWGERFTESARTYWSVHVDGVLYKAGDVVMVEPDSEDSSIQVLKASQTVNKYGNQWWFCQIRYFFEKPSRQGSIKMFHGLWFTHGSKTLLQETSHSKALYLLKCCDDNPVTSIFRKCNFRVAQPLEQEIEDDGSHNSNDFFCSHLYDEDIVAFLDIPPSALVVDQSKPPKSCFSCAYKVEQDMVAEIISEPDQIIVHGISYHVNDFIFIHPEPSSASKLLGIGQIIKLDEHKVHVTLLGRYDDYVAYQREQSFNNQTLIYDERRLYFRHKSLVISADRIDGLCYVFFLTDETKIKAWVKLDDHFYLNQTGSRKHLYPVKKDEFAFCESCYQADLRARQHVERFLQTNSKLIGMELFSGAGGLGTGMDLSDFVDTRYAIEFSPSAAKTYKRNHPHTEVYCQDSSNLLKFTITGKNSDSQLGPPLSNIDDKRCPPLPKRSDNIDFIFGGPPCQSFSQANHSKRRDDIRSTLACNMLSYVEYYEPKYFLLENVAGFLDHKFYTARETEAGEVESEIRAGMVKFVMRTLIALGYQVHFKLLQSGQYGIPQSRRRVIFWAAKRGIPLPQFPVPVYVFPTTIHRIKLPTERVLYPLTRSRIPDEDHYHQFAPLRARTVNDAIGDLPPFDWKNPHSIISETSSSHKEAWKREHELNIPVFEAVKQGHDKFSSLPGYPDGASYPVQPQNSYQQWLRQGMKKGELVTSHYTTWMASKVVEATVNVPLRPLADHRDLPSSLLPNHAKPHARKKNRTFYGRMDGDGHFKCAVTTLSPTLKNQWPVHPSQKRIISVREAARSQGFPDNYIFESCNTSPSKIIQDQLRQIGNAAAIPFALALGKELGKAMILSWEEKEREGSVPL
ncbi:S-adenosyl-L-methionine-dependent methyltransferase [Gymnopilus junonius]|uniref:Cytosine-specific methyltransferase n=1 Tax=Gymnopilus junonius TaxID=109634 RepID=A0A9P5NYH1_GYMJU|nr:S-adenosyl-L-methionine-dependent methyltransferase [Gymnopilus junonius]